ncbi:MAG: hypothetical protein R3C58_07480 [Parvularculaceae bacterium]
MVFNNKHNEDAPRFPGVITFAIIFGWFGAMLYAGDTGLLRTWNGIGPLSALQTCIVAPIAIFFAAYLLLSPFRRYVLGLDPATLAAVQIIRILGSAHFISWGYGLMAGSFAFAVGGGNFIIMLIALHTTYRTAHRLPGWRLSMYALTLLGLAEFAMTIALANLGFFTKPLPFDPPVAAGGYASFLDLPISIYPSFLIPLFCVFHFATLMRLAKGAR